MTSHTATPSSRSGFPILSILPLRRKTQAPGSPPSCHIDISSLARSLRVGDVVFTQIGTGLFHKIAQATGTWTNHVGIVVAVADAEARVAESRVPLSGTTTFQRFVARSEQGRVAIGRLHGPLTSTQQGRLSEAVRRRSHVLYDTGFNLHSRRQFCSRFVHEVLADATGIHVGAVESFAQLLARQPQAALGFWRLWYLGRIPWERETVTPASLLHSPALEIIYDGNAQAK